MGEGVGSQKKPQHQAQFLLWLQQRDEKLGSPLHMGQTMLLSPYTSAPAQERSPEGH